MPRYSVEISYDGGRFAGWQVQPNAISVQEVLEDSLSLLNGKRVRVMGAGRTDAGVHAKAQVASFDMGKVWDVDRLVLAVNAHLPEGASVISARERGEDFDARRSALWREYVYFVWNARVCYPFLRPYVWWRKGGAWDDELVERCCRLIEGEHDFSSFCRLSEVPENAVRNIFFMRYFRRGNYGVFRIRGNAFLTNMIRIMMGNIDGVATGKQPIEWLEGLLEGGSIVDSAFTAPPCGLFFWKVGYDD